MLSLTTILPQSFAGARISMPATAIRMQEAAAAPVEEEPPFDSVAFAKSLPGVADPLGFFDPAGFCSEEVRGRK